MNHPDRALRRRNLVLTEMANGRQDYGGAGCRGEGSAAGFEDRSSAEQRGAVLCGGGAQGSWRKKYGVDEVHGAGLRVYTTLDLDLQKVANKAVLDGTAKYERRHGWKGNLQNVIAAGLDEEHVPASGLVAAGSGGGLCARYGAFRRCEECGGEGFGFADGVARGSGGLGVDAAEGRRLVFEAGRLGLCADFVGGCGRRWAGDAAAGHGCAGFDDGDRQLERRGDCDGGRARLCAEPVQPGDAIAAAGWVERSSLMCIRRRSRRG